MEIRLRILLLTLLLGLSGGLSGVRDAAAICLAPAPLRRPRPLRMRAPAPIATADEDTTPPRVIEPEVERRNVKVPRIKSQDVEVGGTSGP